jgi:hypothetical protein
MKQRFAKLWESLKGTETPSILKRKEIVYE